MQFNFSLIIEASVWVCIETLSNAETFFSRYLSNIEISLSCFVVHECFIVIEIVKKKKKKKDANCL